MSSHIYSLYQKTPHTHYILTKCCACFCLSEEDEVIKTRVLLLQLMQNCFSMLPNPLKSQGTDEAKGATEEGATAFPSTSSSKEPSLDSVKAVQELYTHLCHSKNI